MSRTRTADAHSEATNCSKSELDAAIESINKAAHLLDVLSNTENDLDDDDRRLLLTKALPLLRDRRTHLKNSRGSTGQVVSCLQSMATLVKLLTKPDFLIFTFENDGLNQALWGLRQVSYAVCELLQTQAAAAEPEHAECAS
jgi:hypothetical protein